MALLAGASGFSFATWRPGFYPPSARPADYLRLYAERLPAVEVNSSYYRLPAADQLERWAATVPDGFRFAMKAPMWMAARGGARRAPDVCARIRALGDRLGPLLVRLADTAPRDDALLEALLDGIDADLQVALDLRDPSWDGVEPLLEPHGAVRVNQVDAPGAGFRYLRLREPPYDDAALADEAARIRPMLDDGLDVFCFFRHEDAPTAPAYATRLLELVNG